MLPAARTTEAMTEELLGWAAQMPIFATHLTGARIHAPPAPLVILLAEGLHSSSPSASTSPYRMCTRPVRGCWQCRWLHVTTRSWDAGVAENVLGQVLDAFHSRMTGLLGRCACRTLADSPQLATLMAKEPSAPQVRFAFP